MHKCSFRFWGLRAISGCHIISKATADFISKLQMIYSLNSAFALTLDVLSSVFKVKDLLTVRC